jgi:hypothetical protein
MGKILFQFRHAGSPPTVEDVIRHFGFHEGELDREYGVVLVDSVESRYVALVDESAERRLAEGLDPNEAGFFSNPTVEPFHAKK